MFETLKARFTILQNRPPFPCQKQVKVVIACCILRNYIHIYDEKDEVQAFEEERLIGKIDEEDDSYYVPMTPVDQNPSRDEL